MATTNIATDIQNITGVTTANAGFITSAQKFVASKIPKDLLGFAKVKSGDIDNGNHNNDKLSTSKITDVVRDGYLCTKITVEQAAFANDSASLQKSTEKFPTYTIIGDSAGAKLQIHPTPTNSKVANYYFIDPTTIDDDTVLMSAVIYHSVSNEYTKLASATVPSFSSVSAPTTPTLTSNSITFNETAPTYSKPTVSLTGDISISDLSITSIAPTPPTLQSNSVTFNQTAPTYQKPVLTLDTLTISDLSITSVSPNTPSLSSSSISFTTNAPSFTAPAMGNLDFADTEDLITNEEDSEMLSARVSEINSKISEFSARIQESQAVFNKENTEYQAELQKSIENAKLSSQDDAQQIQKYNAEINDFQASVNKEIQEYRQNLEKELELWTRKRTTDLQKYQSDIQNNLNTFNEENAEYQAELQVSIQNAQLSSQDDVQLLQKYSNDITVYQNNVNKEIQQFSQNTEKDIQLFTIKRNTELQKFQNDIQNELNEFNKENVAYQALLQKAIEDARLASQDDVQKIQNYSSEIQEYQTQVNEELQKFASNLQKSQFYSAESKKYYDWSVNEVTLYIQNNSDILKATLAQQSRR